MSEEPKQRIAIWKLLVCVGLMAVGVYAIGELLRSNGHESQPVAHSVMDRILQGQTSEQGRALTTSLASTMQPQSGVSTRSLKMYYEHRAYAGAPPVIPHVVDPEIARTMSCNTCHARGGYVPGFNAYTPITPHPQYENCMQCHVESSSTKLFAQTTWQSAPPPDIHRPALPGNPPPIPHTLQLRDNCLACHSGPAAVAEVRTSHPERLNCRQCHVPQAPIAVFDRAQLNKGSD